MYYVYCVCMGVLPVKISLCAVPAKARKGVAVRTLGNGVTEPPYEC